jgi:phenylalanyl-tRNA synthetase beta chain
MLPSLMDVVCRNLNAGSTAPIRLFQINRTYLPAGKRRTGGHHVDENLLPEEPLFLQFAIAGSRELGIGDAPQDLLEIKGTIAALSTYLRVPLSLEIGDVEPWLQAGAQWKVVTEDSREVGSAGHVASTVASAFEVEESVAVVEINLNALDLAPRTRKIANFGRFPAIKRDLSLLVPEAISYGQIEETVLAKGGALLNQVALFDIYSGQGVPEGYASYGIRLKFRSAKSNLKGKAVDKAIESILKGLDEGFGITSRG